MAETINYAGDFKIEQAEILTSAGHVINVLPFLMHVTIFEDILTPSLSGDITIFDNSNIITNGPLIGQEQLKLVLSTPTIEGDEHKIYFVEEPLMIYKVAKQAKLNNSTQLYVLSFITNETLTNERMTVSKSFDGSFSDLVEDIFVSELKSTKTINIEETINSKRIVIPDIKPFDVIRNAMTQSISKENESSSFLFYETKSGYNFRSLESLYVKKPVHDYKFFQANIKTDDKLSSDYSRIRNYKIISNSDILLGTRGGFFGSNVLVHDSYNKELTRYTFNYFDNFQQTEHMGYHDDEKANPIFSEVQVDGDGNRISDFPNSRTHLHSTAIKDTTTGTSASHEVNGNYAFSGSKINEWYLPRQSKFMGLAFSHILEVEIAGITGIEAGDTVDIELPITGVGNTQGEKVDTIRSGKFLIKELRHDFNVPERQHGIKMNVVKNSVSKHHSSGANPPTRR
tara:strand:+ start:85 stop:1452 length:1368 start_codon:yes stop_codon:yes gene_type:complete